MNIHHAVKAINQKYKSNQEATEAIQEVSKIYSESLRGLITMLSKPKQSLYEQLKSYSELLTATFKKIISNPSVTKDEINEAKEIFRSKLDELDKIVEATKCV